MLKKEELSLEDLVRVFGEGYTEDEYDYLLEEFNGWMFDSGKSERKSIRELAKQTALTQLTIRKKRKLELSVERELKILNELISSLEKY